MQVSMENLLTSRFPVGQEQVYALATNVARSESRSNAHSHCKDATT
jgi:hypothetical protein